MSPFVRFALVALLMLASVLPAWAQVEVQPTELDVQPQHYGVSVNGVDVSDDSVFYLADDGTIFASSHDLAAWNLRYQEQPAFVRNGASYYGLQTQLKLAVAVQHPQERLQIIAPPTAFLDGPERQLFALTPGGGTFLNYKLDYRGATEFSPAETAGQYEIFFTKNAWSLQTNYRSLQTSSGIQFVRQSSTLSATDFRNHRDITLGEQRMDAGDVGSNPDFIGLYVASNYSVDPHFITQALPSVRGVATQPSLVEVYANNTLQWRQQVPEGPFTVRNLPPSAAYGDVTIVLTDATGHRTTEIVRPTYDAGLATRGNTQYTFNAGLLEREPANFGFGEPQATSSFGASTLLRHGVTSWLTLQAMGESLGGDPFGAIGAELRPFVGNATIWFGNGKLRRTGRFSYDWSGDKISFSERLEYNAEQRPDPFDPNGLSSRFREEGQLQYSPTYDLRFELKLDREATSDGSAQSLLTLISSYAFGAVDLTFEPMYDRSRHAIDLRLQLSQRAGATHRITEAGNQPAGAPLSGSVGYSRSPRDPDDWWRYGVNAAMGRSLTRTVTVDSQMPWTLARFQGQDTTGLGGNIIGEMEGAVGLPYGAGALATRDKYQESVIGVVRIPGFGGVRIDVNGSPAGYTDPSGKLVVPYLSSLQENIVTADISGLPLGVDVTDPVVVVPLPATPVSVNMLPPRAQSIVLRVVDTNGRALPPATWLVSDSGQRFPIGYDGRTYIHGLRAGSHRFTTTSSPACAFDLNFAREWGIVEGQTSVCR